MSRERHVPIPPCDIKSPLRGGTVPPPTKNLKQEPCFEVIFHEGCRRPLRLSQFVALNCLGRHSPFIIKIKHENLEDDLTGR
jgi:hypothetical protein